MQALRSLSLIFGVFLGIVACGRCRQTATGNCRLSQANAGIGIIERGVPHRGVPQKCVRGRASGATVRSGHRPAQGF